MKKFRMPPGYSPEVHEYVTKKDLKMPTKQERIDEFTKILSKQNPKHIAELEHIKKVLSDADYKLPNGNQDYKNVDFKNLKTKDDIQNAYIVFNHAMEASHAFNVTKAYCKAMCKKFDAMVDDNNQEIYNRAHDPIIVFKVENLLTSPGVSRALTDAEIAKNFQDIQNELSKYGEAIKL